MTESVVMRALAHPARLAILDHLGGGRGATATECARVCGLSPSATSYHLRLLARAGLVEEAPGRGDGRERLWRSRARRVEFAPGEGTAPGDREAAGDLIVAVLRRDEAMLREWLERDETNPSEWSQAVRVERLTLVLTPSEAVELAESISQQLQRYTRLNRPDPPEQARPVAATFRLFPVE